MNANNLFVETHLTHVRELKTENARLREALAKQTAENESLRSHFDLALVAARDFDMLAADGTLLIVDGWNALLGSASILPADQRRNVPMKEKETFLCARVQAYLAVHPQDRAWIVFDGAHLGGRTDDRLRVSYTGGTGPHRADHLVCDYLRMCRLVGGPKKIRVLTEDKDFRRNATALGIVVGSVRELNSCAS